LQFLRQANTLQQRVDGTAKHVTALRRLLDDVEFLAKILPAKRVNQLSLDELVSLVSGLHANHRTPHQIPKLNQIERSLAASGVEKLVAEIRSRKPEVRLWPEIFEYAWFASALDNVSQTDPEIGGFVGSTHSRYVDEFHEVGRRANRPGSRPRSASAR
jgi:hypothetical protein